MNSSKAFGTKKFVAKMRFIILCNEKQSKFFKMCWCFSEAQSKQKCKNYFEETQKSSHVVNCKGNFVLKMFINRNVSLRLNFPIKEKFLKNFNSKRIGRKPSIFMKSNVMIAML